MSNLIIFISYIAISAALLRYGIRIGWDYDPGLLGPAILTFNFNTMLALYSSAKKTE